MLSRRGDLYKQLPIPAYVANVQSRTFDTELINMSVRATT